MDGSRAPRTFRTAPIDRLHELLRYDAESGLLYWKGDRGRASRKWPVAGSLVGNGYLAVEVDGLKIKAHRIAWAMVHNEWPKHQLDHINGNRTDNRLANLREVTNGENQRNRQRNFNNMSGRVGVTWHKTNRKWQANLRIDGKDLYLGSFDDLNEACAARDAAEAKYGFHENHGRDPERATFASLRARAEAAEAKVAELEALVSEGAATIAELLGYIEGEGMPGDYSAERALLARMGGEHDRS